MVEPRAPYADVAAVGDQRKRTRSGAFIVPPDDECGGGTEGGDEGAAASAADSPSSALIPTSFSYSSASYLLGYVSSPSPSHLVADGAAAFTPLPPYTLPAEFLCPLTSSIMYDPVLDRRGRSCERRALLRHPNGDSSLPIPGPLEEDVLVPNVALRQLIHRFMGDEWVRRKAADLAHEADEEDECDDDDDDDDVFEEGRSRKRPAGEGKSEGQQPSCPHIARMNALLTAMPSPNLNLANDIRGSTSGGGTSAAAHLRLLLPPRLRLNASGSAAFRCHHRGGLVVVLDVPAGVGLFHLYTRGLLHNPSSEVQRRMLELNFLQGETRGGCLSIRTRRRGEGSQRADGAPSTGADGSEHGDDDDDDGHGPSCEVVFSYNDRVGEITARDLRNVLLNFVETSLSIRERLTAKAASDGNHGRVASSMEDEGRRCDS